MYNASIEDVLKPYEDDQPTPIITIPKTDKIQRIPRLVDDSGRILPKFQTFYSMIVSSISEEWNDHSKAAMFHLSDGAMCDDSFKSYISSQYDRILNKFYALPEHCRKMDIEINLERFKTSHRNIVGGLTVSLYMVHVIEDEFATRTEFSEYSTEIKFTYINDEFCIISNFEPFVKSES